MNWLTIDAGPAENRHRWRGIGAFARAVAMSLDDETFDPGVSYLSSRPIGSSPVRWRARSALARLTGVDPRLPDRVSLAWQLVDTASVLPRDVRRTGARVFLASDPNAIALSGRFSTVAVVYDFIPLIFPGEYLRGTRATLRRLAFNNSIRRLRKCRGLVAISDATRNDAMRLLGIPRARIERVALAVDHAVFHPGAADGRLSVTGGAPYLLYVGEADSRKNVTALIDVFLELGRPEIHLVLVGGAEKTRSHLQDLSHRDRHARIHIVGRVDAQALAGLYADAMGFVFPSLYEGFGLPVLEAMACGAPVVCSPRSALPEVAGNAALFADPDHAGALAHAIRRIVSEPGLRAELRGLGIEHAARFTWRATRDGMVEACRRLG